MPQRQQQALLALEPAHRTQHVCLPLPRLPLLGHVDCDLQVVALCDVPVALEPLVADLYALLARLFLLLRIVTSHIKYLT